MAKTNLHLAKQNFKFSSAHFLIFNATEAERLHGHNYQVKVDLHLPAEEEFPNQGFFVDFNVFKKEIKAALDEWDERVLLPAKNSEMVITPHAKELDVRFRDRHYVFPANEVVLLPVNNTSVEQLSHLLAQKFFAQFAPRGVRGLQVWVEETAGQSASTTI